MSSRHSVPADRPPAYGTASTATVRTTRRPPTAVVDPPAEPEYFRLEVHPERDTARVAAVGELDLATVPQVRAQLDQLADAGFSSLVLDLRGTSFLDATGLRLALDWHAHARTHHLEFSILPGPPAVMRIFDITGVADRLPFTRPPQGPRLP